MYREIQTEYLKTFPQFQPSRRPRVGAVLKEVRIDKGIRQFEFARMSGLNEATLKSIENDHQKATTIRNLEAFAGILDLSLEDLVLLGRERDPANFFVLKRSAPPVIRGIRKRKQAPAEWHESVRLRMGEFDVIPISAPIFMRRDFFMLRVNLPPRRALENLCLPERGSVLGFVAKGFHLRLRQSGSEDVLLTTNQGFQLDGQIPHSISNEDDDQAAVLYLITRFPSPHKKTRSAGRPPAPLTTPLISDGIEQMRQTISKRGHRPISVQHLADLSDQLDHEQITKMMRLKKGSSVIYWEKIEDLLSGTGVSMEDFLNWSYRRRQNPPEKITAGKRAVIDLTTYYGLKLYTITAPGNPHDFFAAELTLEGRGSIPRRNWKRKDPAMIALYVEEGEIEVTVGRKRSPLPLVKGESIYFDGSLGYELRNPAPSQAKALFAASPAPAF